MSSTVGITLRSSILAALGAGVGVHAAAQDAAGPAGTEEIEDSSAQTV